MVISSKKESEVPQVVERLEEEEGGYTPRVQQARERAWTQEDRGRARARAGLLPRRDDVDHAAVYRADLNVVIPDSNLAADFSLDMRLYVSGRE